MKLIWDVALEIGSFIYGRFGETVMAKSTEEVVLYHGSLAELNGRSSEEQYAFADKRVFVSNSSRIDDLPNTVRDQLGEDGLGLVNARIFYSGQVILGRFPSDKNEHGFRMEGTPIARVS